jgi:disulfide bond formation protein DsbB
MRTMNSAPPVRALSQAINAVLRLPRCNEPVGEGANRPRTTLILTPNTPKTTVAVVEIHLTTHPHDRTWYVRTFGDVQPAADVDTLIVMIGLNVLAMERFFALLALAAGALAIAIIAARLLPAAHHLLDIVRPARLWLAWLIAAVAMAGSLYFSESANFVPCKLCWFQRIAMYPLALLLLIAALRRDEGIRRYAIPLASIGAVISSYHYLIEWRPSLGTGTCEITAPCTVPWFRQFGFVSLPLMALCGFAAIVSLLALSSSREEV